MYNGHSIFFQQQRKMGSHFRNISADGIEWFCQGINNLFIRKNFISGKDLQPAVSLETAAEALLAQGITTPTELERILQR